MECRNCGGRLRKCYVKKRVDGKPRFVQVGWHCYDCHRFFKV